MNKYKIGKYIVTANSICDAVSIVRQIKDTSDDFDKDYARESQAVEKDVKKANEDYNRLGNKSASELFEMMGYKRDGHKYYKSNGSYTRVIVFNDFDDIKYYVLKDGVIPRGWTLTKTKWYDSIKDSRRINYDDDIIEVTLNGKVVFRGYAEDWLDNNFDSNFKWTGSQYEASNAKGKWVVRVIDSFRDSRTISPWALSRGKRILSEDGDKATVVSVKGDRRNGYDVVVKFDDGSTDKWYYMPDDVITVIDSGEKIGTMTDSVEKTGDSVNDSIGSDIVSEVKRAYPGVGVSQVAKNRLANNGKNYRSTELTFDFNKISDKFESADRMFSYIQTKHPDEVRTFKKSNKTYVVMIFENLKKDSFQKDSVTVRDIIQSLVTEETSAISSYNVALKTLKDHIPDEAYKAIKAIRDDEQRHVENLYAVLNGNVTPKNLEN